MEGNLEGCLLVKRSIRLVIVTPHSDAVDSVIASLEAEHETLCITRITEAPRVLPACEEFLPDFVLLDVDTPGLCGTDMTRTIRTQFPQIDVLAFTRRRDETTVRAMLQAGAIGYLLTDTPHSTLVSALSAARAGQMVFSPEVLQILMKAPPDSSFQW